MRPICATITAAVVLAAAMAVLAAGSVAAPAVTGPAAVPAVAAPRMAAVEARRAEHSPAVCHVASAGSDLLHSTRCSAGTLTFRLGYMPELTRLPGGRAVHVEPDGSCSWIPDRPFGFDFHNACRMHDLGYDLIRVRWVDAAAKPHIDDAMRDGMLHACTPEHGLRRLLCRALAGAAWLAASLAPTPSEPDPGSFAMPSATAARAG